MENFTAWHGRKISLATQKYRAIFDKQVCPNKILQNKQRYTTKQPLAVSHWPLAKQQTPRQRHPELVSGSHREPPLILLRGQMLKFAIKRVQSQACLNYAEREQIEQR